MDSKHLYEQKILVEEVVYLKNWRDHLELKKNIGLKKNKNSEVLLIAANQKGYDKIIACSWNWTDYRKLKDIISSYKLKKKKKIELALLVLEIGNFSI